MFEKRKFPRLGESWNVDYRAIQTADLKMDIIDGLTVNISGGGFRFESDEKIPKGTMLAVELKSAEFPSPIMALAKTVWCKEKIIQKYDIGVEFWWTGWKNNDAQKSILDYVNEQVTKKGS